MAQLIEILDLLPVDVVRRAFAASSFNSLRATSRQSRDVCNRVSPQVRVRIADPLNSMRTARFLGLREGLKTLTLYPDQRTSGVLSEAPLLLFLGAWPRPSAARIKLLQLAHWQLTLAATGLIATAFPHLECLALKSCHLLHPGAGTPELDLIVLQPLAACTALHSFRINKSTLPMRALGALPHLQTVHVENVMFRCGDVSGMSRLTHLLLVLPLFSSRMELQHLSALVNLKVLMLECGMDDTHALVQFDQQLGRALQGMPQLQELGMYSLGSQSLAALRATPQLTKLSMCYVDAHLATPPVHLPRLQFAHVKEDVPIALGNLAALLAAAPMQASIQLAQEGVDITLGGAQNAEVVTSALSNLAARMSMKRVVGVSNAHVFCQGASVNVQAWLAGWPQMPFVSRELVVSGLSGIAAAEVACIAACFPRVQQLRFNRCSGLGMHALVPLVSLPLNSLALFGCDGLRAVDLGWFLALHPRVTLETDVPGFDKDVFGLSDEQTRIVRTWFGLS